MGEDKICQRFMNLLDNYIDDALTDEETAFMKAHAKECERCAKEMRLCDIIKNEVKGMDDDIYVPLKAQAAWRNAVRKEIRQKRFKKVKRAISGIAAAFVVLVGATFAMRSAGTLPPRKTDDGVSVHSPAALKIMSEDESIPAFSVPEAAYQMKAAQANAFVIESDGETDDLIMAGMESENIIKSCDVVVESQSIDEDIQAIYDLTEEYEGYVSEDIRDFSDSGDHAEIVSRIPVDLMDDYISAAENMAKVVSISRFSQNADEIYFDIDSRLESKKALCDEISALIENASEETVLILNDEINRIYAEIDTLTRLINTRDNDLMYAKVKIILNQLLETPVTPSEYTLKDRSAKGFMQSLTAIGDFFQDMVVSVAVIAPAALLAAVIAFAVIVLVKNVRKNRKSKKKEMDE